MALELITGQKCKINNSTKTAMALKIRKGSLVGCSVTLQQQSLYNFYEFLILALSRSENFQGLTLDKFMKSNKNSFSFTLEDLFTFYQIETDLDPSIKNLDITVLYNTNSWEEKAFLTSSYKLPILQKKKKQK